MASLPETISFDRTERVDAAREEPDALRLIAEADALGIPWRRVLTQEILAEGTLQRFLGPDIAELPGEPVPHPELALPFVEDQVSWTDLLGSLGARAAAAGAGCHALPELTGPRARHLTSEGLAKHYSSLPPVLGSRAWRSPPRKSWTKDLPHFARHRLTGADARRQWAARAQRRPAGPCPATPARARRGLRDHRPRRSAAFSRLRRSSSPADSEESTVDDRRSTSGPPRPPAGSHAAPHPVIREEQSDEDLPCPKGKTQILRFAQDDGKWEEG
jgi:hypothetical protein